MSTVISFKTWQRLHLGTEGINSLVKEVKGLGVEITDWAEEIFEQINPIGAIELELVKVYLRTEDGLPRPKEPGESVGRTLRPMYIQAFENELCLCPPETALYLFREKPKNIELGRFRLAMKPVLCSTPDQVPYDYRKHDRGSRPSGQKNVLQVIDQTHSCGQSRVIGATSGDPDDFTDGGVAVLFCRASPELRRLGLGEPE